MLNKFFITDPDKDEQNQKDNRLKKLIPNMITLTSMVCGLTAIQEAIGADWANAAILIVIAAILDSIDGAIARLLNATSKFGAELDSLADFLSFGVAPATVMYLWILNDAGKIGWIAALVFAIAAALRLARFNATADEREETPEWGRYFFSGVPAPAGAGLALLPLILYMQLNMDLSHYGFASPLIGLWTLMIAALMVSRIPTFSTKQVRLPALGTIPTLAIGGLILAMLVHALWMTLSAVILLYTAMITVSYRLYKSREKRSKNSVT